MAGAPGETGSRSPDTAVLVLFPPPTLLANAAIAASRVAAWPWVEVAIASYAAKPSPVDFFGAEKFEMRSIAGVN